MSSILWDRRTMSYSNLRLFNLSPVIFNPLSFQLLSKYPFKGSWEQFHCVTLTDAAANLKRFLGLVQSNRWCTIFLQLFNECDVSLQSARAFSSPVLDGVKCFFIVHKDNYERYSILVENPNSDLQQSHSLLIYKEAVRQNFCLFKCIKNLKLIRK